MEVLLRKEIINSYDITASKLEVEKILTEYIRVKYTFTNIQNLGDEYYDSSTGIKFELREEMFTTNASNRTANKAIFKVDNEIEAMELEYSINKLRTKFTDIEKDIFDLVLLDKQPQRIVEDKYRMTRGGLDPIKRSCIIKSALHFNVAIRKSVKE